MSSYWLNKVLYKIKRDRAYRELFLSQFNDAVKGFELTTEELNALRERDCAKLYELGAKSMLLLPFAGIAKAGELFVIKDLAK